MPKQSEQQLRVRVRALEAETAERVAQVRDLTLEVARAQRREQLRLAQMLHDGLQQLLVAAKMRAGLARTQAPAGLVVEQLDEVEKLLGESIMLTRWLCADLNPMVVRNQGLGAALRWLGEQLHRRHDLHVEVTFQPGAEPANVEIRELLFETARELLFNVVKHAGVNRAAVCVEAVAPKRLRVRVEDAGRGFDQTEVEARIAHAEGLGLASMRQRLALLGGRIEWASAPGKGAQVTVELPVEA